MSDSIRVDRWLWAVRIAKTRSASTALCKGGHVKVAGSSAKPSTMVRVGDRVEAYVHDRLRVLEVVKLIEKRVGASVAAECLIDHSPPVVASEWVPPVAARERGAGRPTKRERRQMDRFKEQ